MIGFEIQGPLIDGVSKPEIVEKKYKGDVLRNIYRWASAQDSTNDNISLNNSVSVIADDFALGNLGNMKYIIWRGSKWKIYSFEENRPRIIIFMGGVYNENT